MMESNYKDKINAKDEELNYDGDRDGLTLKEELNYGLNPNSPDTDGDGIIDGKEVAMGTNPNRDELLLARQLESLSPPPVEPETLKAKLRDRYLNYARQVLKRPRLSYAELYREINGDRYLGEALDKSILEEAQSNDPPNEAVYLLAQSPFLQHQKQWHGREENIEYVKSLVHPRAIV